MIYICFKFLACRLLAQKPYFQVHCLASIVITLLYKDGICLSSDVFDIEETHMNRQNGLNVPLMCKRPERQFGNEAH